MHIQDHLQLLKGKKFIITSAQVGKASIDNTCSDELQEVLQTCIAGTRRSWHTALTTLSAQGLPSQYTDEDFL